MYNATENIQRAFCWRIEEWDLCTWSTRTTSHSSSEVYEWQCEYYVLRANIEKRCRMPLSEHVPALTHARVHECIGNSTRTHRQVRAYTNISVSLRFPRYPLRIYLFFQVTRMISAWRWIRCLFLVGNILNRVNDTFAFYYDDSLHDCYIRRSRNF